LGPKNGKVTDGALLLPEGGEERPVRQRTVHRFGDAEDHAETALADLLQQFVAIDDIPGAIGDGDDVVGSRALACSVRA